jgi:PAS domain-containing protein
MKPRTADQFPHVNIDSIAAGNDAGKSNFCNKDAHIPDIIIQTNTDFIITGWNDAAEKIYNLPLAPGKNFFELDNVFFSDETIALMKKRFWESGTWDRDIKFKNAAGEFIYFRSSAHCITDQNTGQASIIISKHNITPQLIAEQKLVEEEAIYKLLIDKLEEGILVIGATGKIIASNKKASEILTLSEEQLIGKLPVSAGWKVYRNDGSIFPDCELPVVVSLQTGFPQKNIEMRIERSTIDSVWICVSSQALVREGEFNPYAVLVSFTDITKQKI